jgi:transcriptional regulator NrdR family protein
MPKGTTNNPKVECPHCGHTLSRVVAIGEPMMQGGYKRYRRCLGCQQRYPTVERPITRAYTSSNVRPD